MQLQVAENFVFWVLSSSLSLSPTSDSTAMSSLHWCSEMYISINQSIKYISGIIHRYSPEDFPTVLVGLLFADVGGRGSFQVFRHGLPSWKVESGKGRSWLWDFFILHPFVLLQILFSGCFKSFIKNWLKSMTMSYYLIIRKKLLHFHFLYILAKFIVGLQ